MTRSTGSSGPRWRASESPEIASMTHLASATGTGAKAECDRSLSDSPLEGDGFEPSVPGQIPARCELAAARRHRLAGDNDNSAVKAARAFVNLHRRPAAR